MSWTVDSTQIRAAPLFQKPDKNLQLCDSCGKSGATYGKQRRSCQPCLQNGLSSASPQYPRQEAGKTANEYNHTSNGGSVFSSAQLVQNKVRATAPNASAAAQVNAHAPGVERATCGLATSLNTALDTPTLQGSTAHDMSSHEPSGISEAEYDFGIDLDFGALYGLETPSNVSTDLPNGKSSGPSNQDPAIASQRETDVLARNRDQDVVSTAATDSIDNHAKCCEEVELCPNDVEGCMTPALRLLQALHTPSATCLSASDKGREPKSIQARATGAVLSTIREAVQVISDILKCPCSSSSQLQLVVVVLCGRITAWYRATIRYDDKSLHSPSSVVKIDALHEELAEQVLHQPITIGEYAFNGEIERSVRAQVVLRELQRLRVVAEGISKRVERTSFGSRRRIGVARRESGFTASEQVARAAMAEVTTAVHKDLAILLHDQLRVAEAEATSILHTDVGVIV
ncbi:MAG: hypothetical protein Q9195_002144 [Heterodermia aff. obscurata]